MIEVNEMLSGNVVVSEEHGGYLLVLKGELNITLVSELHKVLVSLVHEEKVICVDAEGIEKLDSAVMQVLAIFVIKAQGMSVAVEWKGISETAANSISTIGLSETMGIEQAA